MILYVNGERLTAYDTNTNGGSNHQTLINKSGVAHAIGRYGSGTYYFDGQMTHIHFSDGYALAPTIFGETDATTGIWKPKTSPSVTYGTNGFFLKMDNSGNIGLDSSGQTNNWTTSGTIIQNKDTPSNVYATWNPLEVSDNAGRSFANVNTSGSITSGNSGTMLGTMGVNSGKWYHEVKVTQSGAGGGSNGIWNYRLSRYFRSN